MRACAQHGSDGSLVERLADQRGAPHKPNERYVLLAGDRTPRITRAIRAIRIIRILRIIGRRCKH